MDMNKYELIKDLTVEELKKLVEINKINKSMSGTYNEPDSEINTITTEEDENALNVEVPLNNSKETKRDDGLKNIYIVFDKITKEGKNDTTVHLAFISRKIKEINQFIDSCCDAMRERYYNEVTITYGGIFHRLSARMGDFHHEMSVEYREDTGSEYDPKWYIDNYL